MARGGQTVDATIVPVPKQRNSRDENEDVKAGKTPRAWKKDPSKNRQKDKDARWTKKHGKSFYGYKNHVNADARHKLIRQYVVTDNYGTALAVPWSSAPRGCGPQSDPGPFFCAGTISDFVLNSLSLGVAYA